MLFCNWSHVFPFSRWRIVVVIVGMTRETQRVCWSIYCPSNMLPANHAMSSTMSLVWLINPFRPPACYQSLQVAGCIMVIPWTYYGALAPHCQLKFWKKEKKEKKIQKKTIAVCVFWAFYGWWFQQKIGSYRNMYMICIKHMV